MTNAQLIEEYIDLAIFHSSSDPENPKNVPGINKAAKRLIAIAEQVSKQHGTDEFAVLLDHKEHGVRNWAAFNLIERMSPSRETVKKALTNIELLSKSEHIDAMGARLWLKNWRKKKTAD